MQDRTDAYQDPNRDGHPPSGNQGLPAGKKIWSMQMLEGGTLDRSESCQGFKKNHDSDRHFTAASIQHIWLNFAISVFAWLPYKNILIPL